MNKAVLVAVQLPGLTTEAMQSSLEELRRLVETLGFAVIGTVTQKRSSPSPSTVIGAGKLKQLALWTGGPGKITSVSKPKTKAAERFAKEEEEDADGEEVPEDPDFEVPSEKASHVIFDQEITPNQLKHLEQATGAEVLDRTGVIVEIFHRHAKTREARLQVEIARLKYLAPRLRATGGGERQGGGIGSKGVGETAHELDRRRIRDRVAELQSELDTIQSDQSHRRNRRRDQFRVALVGYTNAGKSSLMRSLTGSEVLVADKLFATLDTTVRALQPELFPRILVSDTVGFIKKLPHDLVASFRSTLDEASEASLLLFVVDASDSEFRSQLEVTKNVLAEIEAIDIPSYLLLNKVDMLDKAQTHLLTREFPEALQISTRNKEDINRVKQLIRVFFEKGMEEAEIVVPYKDPHGLLGEIRKVASVIREHHEEVGVRLKIKSYPETIAKIKKKAAESA